MASPAYALPPAEPEADRHLVQAASFVLSLRARGVRDVAVLRAMETVPRETFAPRRFADLARTDAALPLACGQTMSGPATVAMMLVALGAKPGQRVLEIGTGSGYVSALLARMGCEVQSIERQAILAESAAHRLEAAGFAGAVKVTTGDGLLPERFGGRFDRILLNGATMAPPTVLTARLAAGGRLVGAVATDRLSRLLVIERDRDGELDVQTGDLLRLTALVAPAADLLAGGPDGRPA